jgi:hypothetical protein
MSDPRRHIERPGPEHWLDAQILGPVLNDDQPASERVRQRGVNNDLRSGLACEGDDAGWPLNFPGGLREGTGSQAVTTRAPELLSPGSFRSQLTAQEVADQRRHLVELVFEREVAGIEEMQFGVWQVA